MSKLKLTEEAFKELERDFNKQKECRKKGHPGEIVESIYPYGYLVMAGCNCIECGAHYSRRATTSEAMGFNFL